MPGYVRMVSEARHEYGGKWFEPGDEFDCEEIHVSLLVTLGRARRAERANGLSYGTRAMTARRGKRGQTVQ